MRKFRKRSLASRLFVLMALPSTLPILADIYLDDANRPFREEGTQISRLGSEGGARESVVEQAPTLEQKLAQIAFAEMRGAPPALGAEMLEGAARPKALAAGVAVLKNPLAAPPGVREADISLASNLALGAGVADRTVWYWQMPDMVLFALAYVAALTLSMVGAWSVLRSLHRFGDGAREIALGRVGGNALAGRNGARELAGLASTVDGLVADLQKTSDQMRIATAENAHALRTPLATIKTAFRAVGRTLPADEPKAQRALSMIEMSLHRLSSMIDAMERHDRAIAEFMAAPREIVNVGRLLHELTREPGDGVDFNAIRFTGPLPDDLLICTSRRALVSALRDVLGGAIDASPDPGDVAVTLEGGDGPGARIVVEDRGCDGEDVDSLFQHDFSPSGEAGAAMAGGVVSCRRGLWHVKRILEAFGGQISAHRNLHGGVSVSIVLPATPY